MRDRTRQPPAPTRSAGYLLVLLWAAILGLFLSLGGGIALAQAPGTPAAASAPAEPPPTVDEAVDQLLRALEDPAVRAELAKRLKANASGEPPPEATSDLVTDSLDVVGVHGVGGVWGGVATGLFASATVGGVDGLFRGNADQMVDQVVAIAVVALYSFVVTSVILKALDITLGLRPSEEEERLGLDVTQHGERGYVFDEPIGVPVSASAPVAAPVPQAVPRTEPSAGA